MLKKQGFRDRKLIDMLKHSNQLLVIEKSVASPVSASVCLCERTVSGWEVLAGSFDATIGRNGFADPGEKLEGDGRSPIGLFRLFTAFGYGPSARTGLQYRQITGEDKWVDDPASAQYNRWVRGETKACSFESMLRADGLYKYGIVVEYNTEPVIPGKGSAIFIHIWRGPGMPTSGCVAMAEADLLEVMAMLDIRKNPVAAMGMSMDEAAGLLSEPG